MVLIFVVLIVLSVGYREAIFNAACIALCIKRGVGMVVSDRMEGESGAT